jgi:hypothetical protein
VQPGVRDQKAFERLRRSEHNAKRRPHRQQPLNKFDRIIRKRYVVEHFDFETLCRAVSGHGSRVALTMDTPYSHIIPGMQEEAAAAIDAAFGAALNKRG